MVLNTEHIVQADVIFAIESTAINGAYFPDIKTNYLLPALEYFSQGAIDDRDYGSETASSLYGIVLYRAADCLPSPSSDTFGPFSSASRVMNTIDKIELIGGKGESHANIAEGLSTALQCLEELGQKHEPNAPTQRHCILICNSPPYSMPVMESHAFVGKTAEQLAGIFQERGINLSIISPRKIPALFKLYEKAGGDLTSFQTKNYAKDPRHLVLLKGFSLKEHEISPPAGSMSNNQQHLTSSMPPSSMPSPLSNQDTQMSVPPQSNQTNLINQNIGPNAIFRPNPPAMAMPNQQQHLQIGGPMPGPGRPVMATGNPQFPNQQIPGPPGYHQSVGGMNTRPRWPMMPPQQRPNNVNYPNNPQSQSALIAQLTQPPNAPFNNQQQMMNSQQQQQLRMMNNPQNVPTSVPQQQIQQPSPQPSNQLTPPSSTATAGTSATVPGSNVTANTQQPQPGANPQQGAQQAQPAQQVGTVRERHTIWKGVLEWLEKVKPSDQEKIKRHVPCQVSANSKDGQPELTATAWPQKLIMQLMPKQLIGNIGGTFLKNSKSVLFHPDNCDALDSLTKVMSSGFAGCVHFTSSVPTACDIKVLILLYTAEKRAYLGFIPNDQVGFVDRLRKVIQQQKSNQILRAGQTGTTGMQPSPNQPGMGQQPNQIGPVGSPQTSQMSTGMMQTNTVSTQPQQIMQPGGAAPRMSMPGMLPGTNTQSNAGQIRPTQGNNMLGGPTGPSQGMRPNFDHMARQQNLDKIMQLKQTLEQAQQQEAQYKSQLEIMNHLKTQQLQEALHVAQQQEMQYKQQMEVMYQEQEQQKQLRVQFQQQMQQQQQQQQRQQMPQQMQQQNVGVPPGQRLMRPAPGPVLSNNPGLRHLLQQQPQYRPQLMGMQQMGQAGPRGPQMNQQMNQNKPTQFDDVSNFEYM